LSLVADGAPPARQRYRELLANFDAADGDLPEIKEARGTRATERCAELAGASALPRGSSPLRLRPPLALLSYERLGDARSVS
jgi:hypothetical protein